MRRLLLREDGNSGAMLYVSKAQCAAWAFLMQAEFWKKAS
jgi:hypothetical protein